MSPELARAGAAEGIGSRYGRVVGHIGMAGLASPGERFAYVRADVKATREDGWFGVKGFGARSLPLGESRDAAPLGQFLTMVLLTFGFAAMILVVIAARLGSAARDRRLALLAVLGGRSGTWIWCSCLRSARPGWPLPSRRRRFGPSGSPPSSGPENSGPGNLVAMARWVILLVSAMIAILMVAMALSAAAEFLALSRSLAPVAILSQRRRFLVGIALWHLTVPGLVAVVVGAEASAAVRGTLKLDVFPGGEELWQPTAQGLPRHAGTVRSDGRRSRFHA